MKKSILNIGLLLAMSFAIVNFTSCSWDAPDRPNVIKVENIIGNTSNVVTAGIRGDDEFFGRFRVPFENNGFTLNLPRTLSDRLLFPLDALFEEAEGVMISDKDARIFMLFRELYGFDSNNRPFGEFRFSVRDERFWGETVWFYADRNVSIRGEIDEEKIDVNLKRGWNRVYLIDELVDETYFYLTTTQRPADANFQWHFSIRGGGLHTYPAETESKSLRNINSLFAR